MKNMKKVVALVFVLMFCVVALSFAADAAPAAPAKPAKPKALKVGDIAADFSLPDGLDKTKTISFEKDIKGKSKVILLSFMTTACSACKAELNLVSDLAGKYAEDVKAYAISVDLNGDKTIPNYDKNYGLNLKYMLDPDFKVPQMYGFSYTPSIVIINKEGKIIFSKGGYDPGSDSDEIVNAVKDAVK